MVVFRSEVIGKIFPAVLVLDSICHDFYCEVVTRDYALGSVDYRSRKEKAISCIGF